MKKALKFLGFVFTIFAILTLVEAPTFAGIFEIECMFLTSVWASPLAYIGFIIFWKWVALIVAVLVVLIVALVPLIKHIHKNHKPRVKKNKVEKESAKRFKKLNKKTANTGVIHSGPAPTANPRGFTRVPPTKDKE